MRTAPTNNPQPSHAELIRRLNDKFRQSFLGGIITLTVGVRALADHVQSRLLLAVRQFENFEAGGDPYGEHDFGTIELAGTRFFWKIDYYNRELDGGSEDPADSGKTTRILTIMAASEY